MNISRLQNYVDMAVITISISDYIMAGTSHLCFEQAQPDLLNVQSFTPAGFQENKSYAKKQVNFVKI